ncbi:histidine kinase [Saccharothrix violaceirubra]
MARDLLAVGAFLLFGTLVNITGLDSPSGRGKLPPFEVREALLVLACAAQTLRHRKVVVAFLLVLPIALADLALGQSTAVQVVFLDLLFLLTLNGPAKVSRFVLHAVAGVTVAIAVVVAVLAGWRLSIAAGLHAFSLLIVPVWWAANVREHRENAESIARIVDLDRRAAVAGERTRIARDLHDVVAGHLSAIAIQSEAVLSAANRDPAVVRTVLESVRENSLDALAEMRAMIDVLRTDDEVDPPATVRLAGLDRLVDSAAAAGTEVRLTRADVSGLPVAVDVAAFRIVQEALTNVLKHAPGARTTAEVGRQSRRLVVIVRNEVRPGTTPGRGTGLVGMAERAGAVGGTCTAGRDGVEWVVRAELPLWATP